jgi:hypothetical protein
MILPFDPRRSLDVYGTVIISGDYSHTSEPGAAEDN